MLCWRFSARLLRPGLVSPNTQHPPTQVAAEKRGRMRREQPRPASEAREAAEVARVPRHKYRFQHGAMQLNQRRTRDEMTVADMHNLFYEGLKPE